MRQPGLFDLPKKELRICPYWWSACGCGTQSGPHSCEWRPLKMESGNETTGSALPGEDRKEDAKMNDAERGREDELNAKVAEHAKRESDLGQREKIDAALREQIAMGNDPRGKRAEPREPIPADVYFSEGDQTFRDPFGVPLGGPFHTNWLARADEFPRVDAPKNPA